MIAVERSVLVNHSAEQMYALVEDIESYPAFLPWCSRSEVGLREPRRTLATLYVNFHGLRQHFTTENAVEPGRRVDMRLVSGPFRRLDGHWRFHALGDNACRVEFGLSWEFSSGLLEKLVGPAFRKIADGMMEAFVQQAQKRFGAQ